MAIIKARMCSRKAKLPVLAGGSPSMKRPISPPRSSSGPGPGRQGQVAQAARVPPLLRRELAALLRLLALDEVDDPDGDAAGYFAAINPADPRVHENCRLTEAFREVVDSFDDLQDAAPRRAAA
ncbi:hypothetical protein [Rhodobacter sp. CZR27]|uniref:hypothetical protein n=1 Tax=Rhodobacter sp. CZR27 TaxID=2033869 RepID=UPI001E600116|nr:hypothetical protein [Rhodobacter sp. CZR27]